MKRHRLGDWIFPSGNSAEAFLRAAGNGRLLVEMQWDDPPPLVPDDERFYRIVVRPALIARMREYTERAGAVLVVEL